MASVHVLHFLLGTSHQNDKLNTGKLEFYESVSLDCSQQIKYSPDKNLNFQSHNNLLCLLNVPSFMIPGELIKFFGLDLSKMTSIRIYRQYSDLESYTAVIQTVSILELNSIINDYDGQLMSTLEGNTFCRLRPVKHISFANSSDFYRVYSNNNFNESCNVDSFILGKPSSGFHELSKSSNSSKSSTLEDESCPVCLESVTTNTFTTCCRHTFHVSCVAKLEGPQCPVCRFQHDAPISGQCECFICGWTAKEFENLANVLQRHPVLNQERDLWVCLICGFTGCGGTGTEGTSMNGNHIYSHYESSLHTYAMNTQNRRVWDFAGDGYVHRLVLNATEGADSDQRQSYAQHESDEVSALKVVETCPLDRYNSQEMDSHMHDRRALPLSSEEEVSVVHRKLEAAAYHYNQLLSWQMQQNRLLFETQLQRIRESSSRSAPAAQVASGVNDWRSHMLESLRQEKARAARQLDVAKERLQRTTRERDVHAELSRSLLHNQGEWRDRLQRAQDMLRVAEDNYILTVAPLERSVESLMEKLDKVHMSSTGSRLADGSPDGLT